MNHLVMCAKSTWQPNIRREHALAGAAVDVGVTTSFVERPRDIRSLAGRGDLRSYLGGMSGDAVTEAANANLQVVSRSVLVPGHLSAAARLLDHSGLRKAVRTAERNVGRPASAVVVNTPWQWGFSKADQARKIVDLADDWRQLLPSHRDTIESQLKRIEDEADEIIVASSDLARCFARPVTLIPNAAADDLFQTPITATPGLRKMTYVGTLSERFDTSLMAAVMSALPDWTLDLFGPCQFRRGGDEPDELLRGLLADHGSRVRWRGVVARDQLAVTLDAADVLVLPNRVELTAGQDSMKLYDYASRGRPIVTTVRHGAEADLPKLITATGADEFAAAVREAGTDSQESAEARRAWAETHRWSRRIGPWLRAVLGEVAAPCV